MWKYCKFFVTGIQLLLDQIFTCFPVVFNKLIVLPRLKARAVETGFRVPRERGWKGAHGSPGRARRNPAPPRRSRSAPRCLLPPGGRTHAPPGTRAHTHAHTFYIYMYTHTYIRTYKYARTDREGCVYTYL